MSTLRSALPPFPQASLYGHGITSISPQYYAEHIIDQFAVMKWLLQLSSVALRQLDQLNSYNVRPAHVQKVTRVLYKGSGDLSTGG